MYTILRQKINYILFFYKVTIFLFFFLLPFTSYIIGNKIGKRIYDIIIILSIFLFFIFALLQRRKKINLWQKMFLNFVIFIFLLITLKSILEFDVLIKFNFRNLFFSLYEFKLLVYIFFAFLFSFVIVPPKKTALYIKKLIKKFILLQIFVFIFNNIYLISIYGLNARIGIADEPAYDGMIFLSSFLLFNFLKREINIKRIFNILMIFSLILTRSKAVIGILTYFLLKDLLIKKKFWKFFIYLFLILGSFYFILTTRLKGTHSLLDIDRVRFFITFLQTLKEYSITNILFGKFPGEVVSYNTDYLDWFFKSDILKHGGVGLYPYAFHGQFLRLFLSFGIIGLIGFMIFYYNLAKYSLGLDFFVMMCIASIGMGFFYLTTVSVPIFIILHNAYYLRTYYIEQDKHRTRRE